MKTRKNKDAKQKAKWKWIRKENGYEWKTCEKEKENDKSIRGRMRNNWKKRR